MKKILVLLSAFGFLFSSCVTTLQQDVFQTTNLNKELMEEISVYEDRFILIDANYLMTGKFDQNQLDSFHQDVYAQLSKSHVEPIIEAHITSIDGILYLMEGKKSKAAECYRDSKAIKGGDDYVLLLGSKLEKNIDSSIQKIDEILSFDPNNSILLLEKGKLLYSKKQYDKSIAFIDEAFIEFDNQGRSNYRAVYKNFRDKVWILYNSGIDVENSSVLSSEQNLASKLTKETMVQLAYEKTGLLNDFTTGTKLSASRLTEKVAEAGMFNPATDPTDGQGLSAEILNSEAIKRITCARFLWNLYVMNRGNPKLAVKYSNRYKKNPAAKSPVADVEISNPDFDAVLGLVENEIMNLPDGKNFFPDTEVVVLDYLSYLKNVK